MILKMITAILFSSLLILCLNNLSNATAEIILLHPKSRSTVVGRCAYFYCKINSSLNSYWVINDDVLAHDDQVMRKETQGFFVDRTKSGSITSLGLRVNTTIDKNETEIYCSSQGINSETAFLTALNENFLSANPSVENPTATSVLLKWSPPFLWPGPHLIYYYKIFVSELDPNGIQNTVVYMENATSNDTFVTFTMAVNDNIQSCNELLFGITAVSINIDNGQSVELPPFFAVGGYLPIPTNITLDSNVNITSLCKDHNKLPVVVITIMLPQSICSYQDIKYRIIIEDSDQFMIQLGPHRYKRHDCSDSIMEIITSSLKEGQLYTLEVIINSVAGNMKSPIYNFTTHLCSSSQEGTAQESKIFMYKVVMSISLCIAFIILLVSTVLLTCACTQQQKKKTGMNHLESSRVRNNNNMMVPNPIYEGPMYESIPPKIETLPTAAMGNSATKEPGRNLVPSCESPLSEPYPSPLDTGRYVEQPQLESTSSNCYLPQCRADDDISISTTGLKLHEPKDSSMKKAESDNHLLQNVAVAGTMGYVPPAFLPEETYTLKNPATGSLNYSEWETGN